MLTPNHLTRLLELAKAATPGPWTALRQGNQYVDTSYMPTARCVAASVLPELVRPWNPHAAIAFGLPAEKHEEARFRDADADYIASASPDVLVALIPIVQAAIELASAQLGNDSRACDVAHQRLHAATVAAFPGIAEEQ